MDPTWILVGLVAGLYVRPRLIREWYYIARNAVTRWRKRIR